MKASFKKTMALILSVLMILGLFTVAGCEKSNEKISASDTVQSVISTSDDPVSSEEKCSHSFTFRSDGTKICTLCGYSEAPLSSVSESFITEDITYIDTGHVFIRVEKGIFVPCGLTEVMEKAYLALEESAGIKFKNGRIIVVVTTDPSSPDDESEMSGGTYAYSDGSGVLHIASGDLALGNSYAFLHEASHVLHHSYTSNSPSQICSEGFAQYNAYKCLKLLEEKDQKTAYFFGPSDFASSDMTIPDPSTVYAESIEYWMENGFPFEYSGNGSYSVGFRFMAYLDEVYGNFNAWIETSGMEKVTNGQDLTIEQEINALKKAYGDDVLDNFYPWLKKNEEHFPTSYVAFSEYDLTEADNLPLYPFFMGFDCATVLVANSI